MLFVAVKREYSAPRSKLIGFFHTLHSGIELTPLLLFMLHMLPPPPLLIALREGELVELFNKGPPEPIMSSFELAADEDVMLKIKNYFNNLKPQEPLLIYKDYLKLVLSLSLPFNEFASFPLDDMM